MNKNSLKPMTAVEYAKCETREAFEKARKLQEELGVPEEERCTLHKSFKRYRSEKRFIALTVEYNKIAADCRKAIAAKRAAEAAKPVNQMLNGLEDKCALDDARKRCQKALAHAQKLQRTAGLTVTPPRSLKALSLDALNTFEAELVGIIQTLSAQAKAEREEREAKAAAKQRCQKPLENLQRLQRMLAENLSPGANHEPTEMLETLEQAQARSLESRTLPELLKLAEELEALEQPFESRTKELLKAEEERKQREAAKREQQHAAQQSIARQRYNESKRLGKVTGSFQVWARSQGYAFAS